MTFNLPTIIVSLIVVVIAVSIIARLIYNKKQGKPGCSCGCSGCAMREMCHSKKEK